MTTDSSGDSASQEYSSGHDVASDSLPYESGEEEHPLEENGSSSSDSGVDLVVSAMQLQVQALETFLELQIFTRSADPETRFSLTGLLQRAREACAAFAADYDEKFIAVWVKVLQRSLGGAV